MVDLNDLARKKDLFIDNAATASQNETLVDDAVTREAIELSVIAPLIVEISERDQRIAALEEQLADMLKADETRARDISRLTVERDNALSALEATPPAPKVTDEDWLAVKQGGVQDMLTALTAAQESGE